MKLEKVFLALRTNYFSDMVEDEHITLKYFNTAQFHDVVHIARELEPFIPTEISLNGMGNWQAGPLYYEVALVNKFENPHLFQFTDTPHITIRKSDRPLSNATFVPEFYDRQIMDTLWLGKKIKGRIVWMPVDKRDIMAMKFNWRYLTVPEYQDETPMPFDTDLSMGHM